MAPTTAMANLWFVRHPGGGATPHRDSPLANNNGKRRMRSHTLHAGLVSKRETSTRIATQVVGKIL